MLRRLKIDPEFQSKIPPLTFEELNLLETNILEEGRILNPLIVWNGLIVDGHNRFAILKNHPEIKYTVLEKEFANRYEAIVWICRNQLGRRNLKPEQFKYVLGQQYEAEKLATNVCRVYTGLTKEEEALVFAEQTGTSTPLSAGAKLRAKLVGQDAESHAFLAATEAAGLKLGTDHVRANHKIVCVSTALKEFQQYGPDIYTEGLQAIVDAWGGDPDSLRAGIIQGVMRFIALYKDEYKYDRLVKRLATVYPMKLVRDADAMSGAASYRYMMQVLILFNGCSKKNMLPVKF